jgi:hypothetical protein
MAATGLEKDGMLFVVVLDFDILRWHALNTVPLLK